MSEKNLFEIASRKKFRFETSKGNISVEDLWEIPLSGKVSLNEIAKTLKRTISQKDEEDFINESRKSFDLDEDKFELVKYIINVRLEEAENKKNAIADRERKSRIKDIINMKKEEELRNMSVEDLEKLL